MSSSFGDGCMNVAEIINGWDPISLFPLAPLDEYHSEISMVQQAMSCCLNEHELADKIYQIFLSAFGDTFVESKQECLNISNKLLMTEPELSPCYDTKTESPGSIPNSSWQLTPGVKSFAPPDAWPARSFFHTNNTVFTVSGSFKRSAANTDAGKIANTLGGRSATSIAEIKRRYSAS